MVTDWSWKLRLFFSADLVGSTAYKASQSTRRSPDWSHTFRAFFHDFPRYLANEGYGKLPTFCPSVAERLRPWKFSGDEILFYVELKKHTDVIAHLTAFKNAVTGFPDEWEKNSIPLKLKATGWLAGFPVTNTEIRLTSAEGSETLDFIGPSVDLGFRIARFATPRRYVLSADLALMLLDAIDVCEINEHSPFTIVYHGREELKGVTNSEPYPIFWLDTEDGQQAIEDKLLGTHRECRHDDIKVFVRQFLDGHPRLLRPFIASDVGSRYSQVPPDLEQVREEMQAEETERGYQTDGEADHAVDGTERTPSEPRLPVKVNQPDHDGATSQ